MTQLQGTAVASEPPVKPAQSRYQGLVAGRRVAGQNLIWLILGATFLFGVTIHGFLSPTNLTNVAWASVPVGCMVLGMFFVMLTGGLDLSLESIYGVAPVIGIVLLNDYLSFLPEPVALVFAVGTGIVAGLLNGLISVKLHVNPFLVTLAALLFWRGLVIFLIPEGIYNLPNGYTFLGSFRFFGFFPVAIVLGLALFGIAWVVINRTAFGKAIYAVGSNPMAAYVAGINVDRVKISVFVIAGLLAGLGGLVEVGRIGAVVDDMGQNSIMMVFAGTILGGTSLAGGRGRLSGILAAILELAMIDNVMNLIGVEPSARQMIFALILLGAIYLASFQERRETVSA
jgi:simple sugar transport system permease protein